MRWRVSPEVKDRNEAILKGMSCMRTGYRQRRQLRGLEKFADRSVVTWEMQQTAHGGQGGAILVQIAKGASEKDIFVVLFL